MSADGQLGFTVTLKDVYDMMVAQGETLASLHARLDNTITRHDVHSDLLEDHENRLRDMEKMVWKASGAATLLSIFGSYIINQLF